MKLSTLDLANQTMIVAEIGNNHEGSYTLAEEMIGLAKEAGVDAVKFQTFKTDLFVSPSNQERFKKLKSFELTEADFEKLSNVAKKAGLLFFSTPLDLESAFFLNSIVSGFKIASGDNNFYPLLEAVAQTGKPIILSSGLADINQLQLSKAYIQNIWREKNIDQDLAILHCVCSYPVPDNQVNLRAIPEMIKHLNCLVGYSDHTMGVTAATLAVALGARIIEKHFTKDKNFSDFRDHKLSADPLEMKQLVKQIRAVQVFLGSHEKLLQNCEKDIILQVRRSIVAKENLKEGDVLTLKNIAWMRPGTGIPPGNEKLVLGKKVKRQLNRGDLVNLDDLA